MTRHDLRLVRWIEERVPDVETPGLRHAIQSIVLTAGGNGERAGTGGKTNVTEMMEMEWGLSESRGEGWGSDASASSVLTPSSTTSDDLVDVEDVDDMSSRNQSRPVLPKTSKPRPMQRRRGGPNNSGTR